jgi:hypothetical protein
LHPPAAGPMILFVEDEIDGRQPVELFTKLFGTWLVFVYHCFDRIVLSGYPMGAAAAGTGGLLARACAGRGSDYQRRVEPAHPGLHRLGGVLCAQSEDPGGMGRKGRAAKKTTCSPFCGAWKVAKATGCTSFSRPWSKGGLIGLVFSWYRGALGDPPPLLAWGPKLSKRKRLRAQVRCTGLLQESRLPILI